MYIYIFGISFILIVVFLIYKFYSKINAYVKKNIIPSQQVKQIKQQMKDLEKVEREKDENQEEGEKSHFSKMMENINEIFYLTIDFLYKWVVLNGTSLLYNFTHNKNI
jgi:hypothetical protein